MELRLGPGVAAGRAAALGRVQRRADEVRAGAQLLADLPAVRGHEVGARRNLRIWRLIRREYNAIGLGASKLF